MIVRGDISRGLQAANIVHAAGESSFTDLPEGTRSVCLVVPDEPALQEVVARLAASSVSFRRVIETEGRYAGQIMAVGCRPTGREVLRRLLSSLPLLR